MVEGAVQPHVQIGVVGLLEQAGAAFFAPEELHHLHPGYRLLQRGAETPEADARLAEGLEGPAL